MKTKLIPSPDEVEAAIAGLRDGSSPYAKLIFEDAHLDKKFERAMYWVTPLQHPEIRACGRTPGEAAAAAFVDAWLDGLLWCTGPVTEEEYRMVPKQVPSGWEFVLHAVPARELQ